MKFEDISRKVNLIDRTAFRKIMGGGKHRQEFSKLAAFGADFLSTAEKNKLKADFSKIIDVPKVDITDYDLETISACITERAVNLR
jgi:hypothetical protein